MADADPENDEERGRSRSPARSGDPFDDEEIRDDEEDGEDLIPDDDRNVLPMGCAKQAWLRLHSIAGLFALCLPNSYQPRLALKAPRYHLRR